MNFNYFELLEENRAQLGRKPVHAAAERATEAKRLKALFGSKRGFSFVRLGDCDLAYLISAENGCSADLSRTDNAVSGTQGKGNPGLGHSQAPRLRAALEQADYLDCHEWLWNDNTLLASLALRRSPGATRNPNRETSYILPAWMEHEFKDYCQNRRVLFCGAEAPLLEELLKHPGFRRAAADFWPEMCKAFFLRPRENGRNLARNLDGIKQDLAAAISKWKIDTLFLSLGGGAKILCFELAQEFRVCAIDFGAFLRSLTYSGSDGNRASRATHAVFLFRVPFGLYMDALEKTFPDLTPEALLAKAHAQLLLEVQEKESGWSHASWEYDFTSENVAHFRKGFHEYKRRYGHLFNKSLITRKERADFLHFCGTHKLTVEGRLFMAKFHAKGLLRRCLGRSSKSSSQ